MLIKHKVEEQANEAYLQFASSIIYLKLNFQIISRIQLFS